MALSLTGLVVFVLAFVIHLIVWRICPPEKHTRSLLIIFMGTLLIAVSIGANLPITFFSSFQPAQWAHLILFHTSMSLAYIITYSAIEEDSPTLSLIRFVDDAGERGRTRQELVDFLQRMSIIQIRLEASLRDRFLVRHGKRYQLTAKGRRLALIFQTAQDILKIRTGG